MFRRAATTFVSSAAAGVQVRAATQTPGSKVVDAIVARVASEAKAAPKKAVAPVKRVKVISPRRSSAQYHSYREFVKEQFAKPSLVKLPPVKRLQTVVQMWREKESAASAAAAAVAEKAHKNSESQAQKLKSSIAKKDAAAAKKKKAEALWRAAEVEQLQAAKAKEAQEKAAWTALVNEIKADAAAKRQKATELLLATQQAAALALAKRREAADQLKKDNAAKAAKLAAAQKKAQLVAKKQIAAKLKRANVQAKGIVGRAKAVAAKQAKAVRVNRQALATLKKQKLVASRNNRRTAQAAIRRLRILNSHVTKTLASIRGDLGKI